MRTWLSPRPMLPFNSSMRGVIGRGLISGGGANMSWPLSSLHFASESCLFNLLSSLSIVPLSSRCLATSGKEAGFFGETLSSSPKEIWLIPAIACCNFHQHTIRIQVSRNPLQNNDSLIDTNKSEYLFYFPQKNAIPGTCEFRFYLLKG